MTEPVMLQFEGTLVKTVALPSPCWGATPHVALRDGRLFVSYLAPTGKNHGEISKVYRSTLDEHTDFSYGRLELLELCQRLVHHAWDTKPPALDRHTAAPGHARIDDSRKELKEALTRVTARLTDAQRNLGRGGYAEELDRVDRIHKLEISQAAFERALVHLTDGQS